MKALNLTPKMMRREIRAYLTMVIGLILFCVAFTTLLIPAKIVAGGVGGISTIIYYVSTLGGGGGIPVGISYFVINAFLLLLGFYIIGPRFGTKTIFAICVNSLLLYIFQEHVPVDLMGLQDDKLLSAVLGGGLIGVGVGLCFSVGGSSGGTDIVAMIINKYRNVSLGKLIMLIDVVIIGCSYFVFRDLPTMVYGYVTMAAMGYAVDLVLSGTRSSTQVMIFSPKYEQIADRILTEVHRGVTVLDATGWYSKSPQKVVMVICRRTETSRVYQVIKEIDPKAFISVGNVMGVYGEGFEALRTK